VSRPQEVKVAVGQGRERDEERKEGLTLEDLFSENWPNLWSCLYNSPFPANSIIKKILFSSWK